jgi:GTPase SAR1 family protein
MVDPIFDYQFRLILIGDSTVGKSSLLKYFTDGKFAEVSIHCFCVVDKVFGEVEINYALIF